MSDRRPITPTEGQHPAGGCLRFAVKGPAGGVVYNVPGNHLALIDRDGDYDSVTGETLARVREYALLDDEDAVMAVLTDLYRTEIAGGASQPR